MHYNTKNLIGLKFGNLIVLDYTEMRYRSFVLWKVQCTGGCSSDPYLVRSNHLLSGRASKCKKCANEKQIRNLTGQIFGKIKVLEITNLRSKDRQVKWKVQCMGNCNSKPYLVKASQLTSGDSTQCRKCSLSSRVSTTERMLIDRVEEYVGVQVVRQFQLENRFYDAYLPKYNLLIESNGTYWHNKERNRAADGEKEKLAKQYGYKLIGVDNDSPKDIPVALEQVKIFIDQL